MCTKKTKTKMKTQIKMWMMIKFWSFRTSFNLHYISLTLLPIGYKWFYLLINIFELPLAVMAVTVLMGSLISCSHVYVMRMTIKFWMGLPSQKQVSSLNNRHTVTVNELWLTVKKKSLMKLLFGRCKNTWRHKLFQLPVY